MRSSSFDVLAPVEPVARAGLLRREHRELGLPIPQHVRLDAEQFAHFADLEVQLIRDLRRTGL